MLIGVFVYSYTVGILTNLISDRDAKVVFLSKSFVYIFIGKRLLE